MHSWTIILIKKQHVYNCFDCKKLTAGKQHISVVTSLLKEQVAPAVAVGLVAVRGKYNYVL